MRKYFGVYLGIILLAGFSSATSLWTMDSKSPLAKASKFAVGDTITIVIEESLSAAQSGTTRAQKGSNTTFSLSNSLQDNQTPASGLASKSSGDTRLNTLFNGASNYTGTGSTQRTTSLKTTITATVVDVQPNGNLFVLGQRSIRVNEEVETVEVSGIVNAAKLSDDNSINSTQIANAKITIRGAGAVSTTQQPGILSSMFNWLF
ncbi:flagellar L-ring protein [Candidatus Termititenax aidoneus]|uniref:Flagellar L-ring protein n=1 Tax=Termititenax aidoneus TaxID=2218524 RepID=A0A388T976_TERA1|nr:flagellar L-ring protein [Candidatus Termititenax aidoneus]